MMDVESKGDLFTSGWLALLMLGIHAYLNLKFGVQASLNIVNRNSYSRVKFEP